MMPQYFQLRNICPRHLSETSRSTMAERPRELGDFKGVGEFEAKFSVQGLRFAPISMDC